MFVSVRTKNKETVGFDVKEEIFLKIFSFLDLKTALLELSLVNKTFYELILKYWKSATFSFEKPSSDFISSLIKYFPNITKIHISDATELEPTVVDSVFELSDVTDIRISKILEDNQNLKVNLSSTCKILDLSQSQVSSLDFGENWALEEMNFAECAILTLPKSFFETSQECLRVLSLKNVLGLADDDVHAFAPLWSNLHILDISEKSLSHGLKTPSVKLIGQHCTKLRKLFLSQMKYIGDSAIEALMPLKDLEELHIDACKQLTVKVLDYCAEMPKLTRLNIGRNVNMFKQNEEETLKKLIGMKLNYLDLTFIPLKEKNYVMLCNEIERLNFSWGISINDFVLKKIAKSTKILKELNVSACKKITSWGLIDLVKFWKHSEPLEKLVVQKNGGRLDMKGIGKVKEAWKNCVVVHDFKKK